MFALTAGTGADMVIMDCVIRMEHLVTRPGSGVTCQPGIEKGGWRQITLTPSTPRYLQGAQIEDTGLSHNTQLQPQHSAPALQPNPYPGLWVSVLCPENVRHLSTPPPTILSIAVLLDDAITPPCVCVCVWGGGALVSQAFP